VIWEKRSIDEGENRQWAKNPSYKPPIPFLEMQKRGRGREDGTVIVCEFFLSLFLLVRIMGFILWGIE